MKGRRGKAKDSFSDEIFRLHVGRCGATTVGDGVVEGTERRGEVVTKQRAGEVDTTTSCLCIPPKCQYLQRKSRELDTARPESQ